MYRNQRQPNIPVAAFCYSTGLPLNAFAPQQDIGSPVYSNDSNKSVAHSHSYFFKPSLATASFPVSTPEALDNYTVTSESLEVMKPTTDNSSPRGSSSARDAPSDAPPIYIPIGQPLADSLTPSVESAKDRWGILERYQYMGAAHANPSSSDQNNNLCHRNQESSIKGLNCEAISETYDWQNGLSIVCRDTKAPESYEEAECEYSDETCRADYDRSGLTINSCWLPLETGKSLSHWKPHKTQHFNNTEISQPVSPTKRRCLDTCHYSGLSLPGFNLLSPLHADHLSTFNPMLPISNTVWQYCNCAETSPTTENNWQQYHTPDELSMIMTSQNNNYSSPFLSLGNGNQTSIKYGACVPGLPLLEDQNSPSNTVSSPSSVSNDGCSPSLFRSKRGRYQEREPSEDQSWGTMLPHFRRSTRLGHSFQLSSNNDRDLPGVYFDKRKKGFRVRFSNVYVGWVSLSSYSTYEAAYAAATNIYDEAAREVAESRDKSAAVNAGIALTIRSRLKAKNPGGRPRTVSKLPPLLDAKIAAVVENAKRINPV